MFNRLESVLISEPSPLSVVVLNALTGQCLYAMNETKVFKAASTIKVPILMTTMALVDAGEIQLADKLTTTACDLVPYSMLNTFHEKNFEIFDLLFLMMSVSDNTATNLVLDKIGFKAVNHFLKTSGISSTTLLRKMMDISSADQGLENLTTPIDLAQLFYRIYTGQGFSPSSRQQMIEFMSTGTCREFMDRYLPESLLIAHKIGELDQLNHDAGIVFLDDSPYIVVIMGDSFSSNGSGRETISRVSKVIYECFINQVNAPAVSLFNPNSYEFTEGLIQEKGAFTITTSSNQGHYLSTVYDIPHLRSIIPSWTIDTPNQSSAQISGRVRIERHWSDWLTWGTWGSRIARGSSKVDKVAQGARIDVDTLLIDAPITADGFQFKVELFRSPTGESPIFKSIDFAIDSLGKHVHEESPLTVNRVLNVPKISQMKREPSMAKVMCSPTTLTMILQYYGADIHPEEVALSVKDYDYGNPESGFGNWVFNMAYLNSLGLQAKVDCITLNDLKRHISQGRPIGISLSYSNDPNHPKFPYIKNSPTSTAGHLIVVCGFEKISGSEYVVVNDPAAEDNQHVRRYYKTSELFEAWKRSDCTAYIITPTVGWINNTIKGELEYVFNHKHCSLLLDECTIQGITCEKEKIELSEKHFFLWMSKRNDEIDWQYNTSSLLPTERSEIRKGFYEWVGYSRDYYCYSTSIELT